MESFNITVSKNNKLFNNLAIFDFESKCVSTDKLKATQKTTWIGKHVPISAYISSKLISGPIPLYNNDPQNLIIDFVSNHELEMSTKSQDIEVAVNERMKKNVDQLTRGGTNFISKQFEYEDECIEDLEEADISTQSLQIQKHQLIELKQHLQRYVYISLVFGFNRGRYNLNLINSYVIPHLIPDKEQEKSVIKKGTSFYFSSLVLYIFSI